MTEYNIDRLHGESLLDHKMRLCVAKLNKEHDLDWSELINIFGLDFSNDHLRKLSYAYREILEERDRVLIESPIDEEVVPYKETIEILKDGSHKSDKLLKMSSEQSKDVDYLLSAHGFDPKVWELVSARNNIWNTNSQAQGVQTLYSSKISVKPLKNGFDIDKLIEKANKEVKPVYVERTSTDGTSLLEIPLFDMHFGIADLDYYKETLHKILDKIEHKSWDTILFIIGQDLLHNDGFEGKTTSGTMIDKVDTEKAWNDAMEFYSQLIKASLPQAKNVVAYYSAGNHDRGISYGFVRTLEAKFPQVKFDTGIKHRKAFVFHDVFIGFTHGDKGHARLSKNFFSEYGKDMGKAKLIEIHTGHLHHEKSKDDLGFLVRTLSTGAKTDDYHYDNGFTGAHKRFQLFEYSKDSLDSIYYI